MRHLRVTYPVSCHAGQTSIHVLVYEVMSPTELAFVRTVNKTNSAVAKNSRKFIKLQAINALKETISG